MTTPLRLILAGSFLALASCTRAEEDKIDRAKAAVKETAHDVAEATKKGAKIAAEKSEVLFDKTAEGTKHAAEVTKEKSREAYEKSKELAVKAKDKTVEVSRVAVEKTKEAAAVTKEKVIEFTTTKDELARYDANHDGKLDAAERARMKAEQTKGAHR